MSGSIIGYEFSERYCQISFYDDEQHEPKTLELLSYPVEDLYARALRQEKITVGGEQCDAVRMLAGFVADSLGRFDDICQLVFTVPTLHMDIVKMLRGIGQRAGISKEQIYVQDYKESFCNYMLYQPKELWQYEAALFHCDRHEVKACMLRKLRTGFGKGKDTFITVDEVASARMEELSAVYPVLNVDRAREADLQFRQFVQGVFEKERVSSVFLVGEGFENSWYPQSLKVLCNGRRAFLGNNLYSKGACYSAHRRTLDYKDSFIYLDETKMMDQICLKMRAHGQDRWEPIVPWGSRWYEADTKWEVLLENTDDIEIHIESLAGADMRVEHVPLTGLPKRKNYTLRLQIKVLFVDEKKCRISFKDMGFGEFFPATDFYLEKEILLGGSNEQFNSLS